MANLKLFVFLLVICGNSLPFLWHKSFWKSVKDVCLAYYAISIGTEKCIWGECVDPLTKKCTPFFQKIQSQPLKKLGQGGYHEVHAIGNTNLVSKSLGGNDQKCFEMNDLGLDNDCGDIRFVTEIVHRLPIIYGVNRPICVTESEKNQYKAISRRVIPLESYKILPGLKYKKDLLYPIISKYRYIVTHVFTVLAEWIRKNSGVAVGDWRVQSDHGTIVTRNIALTPTGEPTFFDFDWRDLHFDRRSTSLPKLTEEIIKIAREELEIAMGNPEWRAFINEVLRIVNFRLRTPSSKCTYY